jgi:hypothetical protein
VKSRDAEDSDAGPSVSLSESKSDLIDFSQNSADMSDHKPSFR